MLSEYQYYTALKQFNDISSDCHGKTRQNLRQKLKKQIKEYESNIKYEKFDVLPHTPYFVNKTTTEQTLHQLIQAATSALEFTIDTESMNVYLKKNKPVLIQIQILLPHQLSLVVLVECFHLPDTNTNHFKLIKQLFEIFFSPDKIIFIWGSKNELDPFAEFKIFSKEQVRSIKSINLQYQFKLFWNKHHPHKHRPTTSLDIPKDCLCEKCIEKKDSEPWGIQDSIGFLFKEYLPKILTRGDFYIGLDPYLFHLDHDEKQYRQELTNYAINDCIAMQRILMEMKEQNFELKIAEEKFIKPQLFELSPINSSDDDEIPHIQVKITLPKISNRIIFSNDQSAPSIAILENNDSLINSDDPPMSHSSEQVPLFVGSQRYPSDWESKDTNGKEANEPDWTNIQINVKDNDQQEPPTQHNELSDDQRRKIHNRKCTIKQRGRYYKNELIFEDIDRRFDIKQIKTILKQQQIPIYLVNTRISKRTHKITLFAAVRNPDAIRKYEEQSRGYFTQEHYNELQANGTLPQANRRHHHQRHQYYRNQHQRNQHYRNQHQRNQHYRNQYQSHRNLHQRNQHHRNHHQEH